MGKESSIGNRMKEFYENRSRIYLSRNSYVMIRVDGKSFSKYTKNMEKPFDENFHQDMNYVAKYLCENIQGAKLSYVQSDEISILITDFDTIKTDAWFDYNLQKMCSISASLATAKFNELRIQRYFADNHVKEHFREGIDLEEHRITVCDIINYFPLQNSPFSKLPVFDSRVMVLPNADEVVNYFIWRQMDATRNSISMAAQANFPHKQLEGKNTGEMQEMLFQEKGINWNDYSTGCKRGRCVVKRNQKYVKYEDTQKPYLYHEGDENKEGATVFERKTWQIDTEIPIFTQDKNYIFDEILIKKEDNSTEEMKKLLMKNNL